MVVDVIVTLSDVQAGFEVARGRGDDLGAALVDLGRQYKINDLNLNEIEIGITTEQQP